MILEVIVLGFMSMYSHSKNGVMCIITRRFNGWYTVLGIFFKNTKLLMGVASECLIVNHPKGHGGRNVTFGQRK